MPNSRDTKGSLPPHRSMQVFLKWQSEVNLTVYIHGDLIDSCRLRGMPSATNPSSSEYLCSRADIGVIEPTNELKTLSNHGSNAKIFVLTHNHKHSDFFARAHGIREERIPNVSKRVQDNSKRVPSAMSFVL